MLAGAAGLALLLAVVFMVPRLLYPPLPASRFAGVTPDKRIELETNRLKLQNDARATLLQALAGGVLLLGAYFTWRQLGVTREGQLTDRYTKAVDQLGSQYLDVRVGGIYALERIARDSPPDRATIEEVLTAFVRTHAPWPPPPPTPTQPAATQQPTTAGMSQPLPPASPAAGTDKAGQPDAVVEPHGPAADVQAAMTVLGRRLRPLEGLWSLDLAGVDLRGAWLADTDLRGARLTDANLRGARLEGANLAGAWLRGADLQGARLTDASLQDAWLPGANLWRTDLDNALLDGARAGTYRGGPETRWPEGWTPEVAKNRGMYVEDFS